MLNQEQRLSLNEPLARYGAQLTEDDDRIAMGGPNLLASFPAARLAKGVSEFVEKFWFWKPV